MKGIAWLIILALVSCKQNAESFFLTGITNGIEDGTVLYMDEPWTQARLDSAILKDNSFEFSTENLPSPTLVFLHTKDLSQYRFLWIEDRRMIFDATDSDFKNAVVSGSETENLKIQFSNTLDTVTSKEKRRNLEMKYVEDNPNSILSAHTLAIYSRLWGARKTNELFQKFSEENKNTNDGKRVADFLARVKNIEKINQGLDVDKGISVGDPYIDFEMKEAGGTIKRLSDLEGNVILLEFWASWCAPCRHENPNLLKVYEKYHSNGFEIFAVSLDLKAERWLEAIKDDNLTWIHVSELNGLQNTASIIYGVNAIPDNFLINKEGIIIGRNIRPSALDEELESIM